MTPQELIAHFEGDDTALQPSAIIEYQNERGLAIRLGENLSEKWQGGEVIVFWDDGDHTVLPDEFELVRLNAYRPDSSDIQGPESEDDNIMVECVGCQQKFSISLEVCPHCGRENIPF